MKTLLRIDSSIRQTDSISRAMGDHFVTRWKEEYPTGKIITRDLQVNPIPHLSQSTVLGFFSGQATSDELALSDLLIDEIMISDELLIKRDGRRFLLINSPSFELGFDLK